MWRVTRGASALRSAWVMARSSAGLSPPRWGASYTRLVPTRQEGHGAGSALWDMGRKRENGPHWGQEYVYVGIEHLLVLAYKISANESNSQGGGGRPARTSEADGGAHAARGTAVRRSEGPSAPAEAVTVRFYRSVTAPQEGLKSPPGPRRGIAPSAEAVLRAMLSTRRALPHRGPLTPIGDNLFI